MASSQDLRPGTIVKFNGDNCVILEHHHVTPGKGPAHHQVKLRNMKTGKQFENRYNTKENVERVRVERRDFQYLYNDGSYLYFMNMENYEQIPVDTELVGDAISYMKENQDVKIAFEDTQVLSVELPAAVVLNVSHTEPGVRGDTATNVLKPATVETGATVQVPLFINEGDMIKVDTRSGEYLERVKE